MPTTVQTTKRWTDINKEGGFISMETVTTEYPEAPTNPADACCDAVLDHLGKLVNLSAEISEKLSKVISLLSTMTP